MKKLKIKQKNKNVGVAVFGDPLFEVITVENRNRTNEKQFIFLLLGILFIFLSTLIESAVWREVILITGWVPIWKMLEIELIPDVYARRKRYIIKKLLNSKIEIRQLLQNYVNYDKIYI